MPRICIVGAGVAGLRCADILLQYGFQVSILEARDRIGGRVHQLTLPSGHEVDLGPNWIHGTEHNAIFEIAKRTNASLCSFGSSTTVFGDDGRVLEDGDKLYMLMWEILDKAFQYSRDNTSTIEPGKSLHDFFEEKITEFVPEGTDCDRQRNIIMQIVELWGAFVGSHVTTQSLKFFWLEESVNGENLFCASRYRNIIDYIARPSLEANIINLSTEIVSIESIDEIVKVTTRAGTILDFDEVVITTPLGWLKRKQQVFKPALHDRFSSAIKSIGYGSLEKVFITFPRAFWLSDDTALDGESFTEFAHWLSPGYAPHTNPLSWEQHCIELSSIPAPHAHPTLLFYVYGDQATSLLDALSTLSTQAEKVKHIANVFRPYFSLLPHYAEGSSDCRPISCLMTNWSTDEFAGFGSYSNFQTELTEGDIDIKIMREGLPDRSLWFAGEHVAPFMAMGTANGAYESGESVAQRIAASYGVAPFTSGQDVPDPQKTVNASNSPDT